MPYIPTENRTRLYNLLENYFRYPGAENSGELNYILTIIINSYFKEHGSNYAAINDVVGALEGAKVEFQRRAVAPYEDKKIKENGDIT